MSGSPIPLTIRTGRSRQLPACATSLTRPTRVSGRPRTEHSRYSNSQWTSYAPRDSAQQAEPSVPVQERLASAVRLAENTGQQLYFASGAHDAQEAKSTQPSGGLRRFCTLALPLLEHLAGVRYPAVTHHIVQTPDHLRLTQPRPALLAAAAAVTGDPGYSHEPLALDAVHTLVRHYLAEQRELLLNDQVSMSAVRMMLEMYVRAGWDKALQLAEELDDLFS